MFAGLSIIVLVLSGAVGTGRTLWWIGWLVGSCSIGVVFKWIEDAWYDNAAAIIIAGTGWRLALLVAGLVLLLGTGAAVKVVWDVFNPAFYRDELPDNWRR